MKRFSMILVAGIALVSSSFALAGRDAAQLREQERANKAVVAQRLAQQGQAQQQKGLAGPIGLPGKSGPAGAAQRPRLPGEHP